MIRKRKEAITRKRRHPNRANTDKYKHLQAKVQKKFRQEYWTYVNNILTPEEGNNQPEMPDLKIKNNFWTYLKHCKNDSIGVAPLRDTTTGILHTDPQAKAELPNKQFQSVFSLNTPLNLYHLSIYLVVYSLHHNVLPTLQSIPLMTNGPLYPITQDSSCHGQHTMPRNPWSFPTTSSA